MALLEKGSLVWLSSGSVDYRKQSSKKQQQSQKRSQLQSALMGGLQCARYRSQCFVCIISFNPCTEHWGGPYRPCFTDEDLEAQKDEGFCSTSHRCGVEVRFEPEQAGNLECCKTHSRLREQWCIEVWKGLAWGRDKASGGHGEMT